MPFNFVVATLIKYSSFYCRNVLPLFPLALKRFLHMMREHLVSPSNEKNSLLVEIQKVVNALKINLEFPPFIPPESYQNSFVISCNCTGI